MAAFIFDASGIVKHYLTEIGSGWVQGLAEPAAALAQADPADVGQEWGALKKLGQRLRREQRIRQLLRDQPPQPAEA